MSGLDIYERGNPRESAAFQQRDVTRIVSFIALQTMLAGSIEATATAVIRMTFNLPKQIIPAGAEPVNQSRVSCVEAISNATSVAIDGGMHADHNEHE